VGAACPTCGGYARVEPGGLRCLIAGHLFTLRAVLSKTTTGSDWRNRLRMRALDRAFTKPGQGGRIPLDLLERLEEGPGPRKADDGDE
jgi:hypothetical protein